MRILVGLAAVLVVSACADRLSEDECLNGDWREIGRVDGIDGNPPGKVDDRIKDCSRFDVPLDTRLYEEGRRLGIEVFCTPEGALDAGLRRVGEIALCDPADRLTYRAYAVARTYANARNNLERLENSYRYDLSSIDNLRYRFERLRSQLRKEKDDEKRAQIRAELRSVDNQIDRAYESLFYTRQQLDFARADFYRAESDFARIRSDIASRAFEDRRDQIWEEPPEDEPSEEGVPVESELFPPLVPGSEGN